MDVWLTPQNLQAFHTIDRTIYGRLVINVGFRHIQAKQVIAFWNWLETIGFSNFVYRLLTFPDLTLRLLAIETLTCFRYLYEEGLDRQSFTFVDKKIPILLGHLRQRFSFSCLYENRQNAISRMEEFIRVFDIAFSDRVPANYLFQFQNAFRPPSSNGLHLRLVYGTPSVTPRKSHLPASIPRARTFLITSCMGQEELQDLIARSFGNCVEKVFVQDQPNMRLLTACVVVRSPSDVYAVLGGKKIARQSVNGKDVWVRRLDLR